VELTHVVVLAVLQGVVEFLPISSSGHLILVPSLLGWPDQGLGFDIAVHAGTLTAVIVYFRHDLLRLVCAAFDAGNREFELAWSLVLASLPLGFAGLLLADLVDTMLRSPAIIASTTAGFGVLLWLADGLNRGNRDDSDLRMHDAVLIGFGQALALVPGTSRSGITMTVGLALGLSRAAAARFSFLLSVPAIGMAASWEAYQLVVTREPVLWGTLSLAAALAAATAFAAITVFLRVIERVGMWSFAVYRLLLAIVIVLVLY
jgi:undecaprenyl-diphosphatase